MAIVLGLRSWYSRAGGFLSPEEAVIAAKAAGASTVAFADVHETGGTVEWLEACRKHAVVPIVGVELNIMFRDQPRPALLFARGGGGVKSLNEAVAASEWTGSELCLPLKENILNNLVLCTGGFEDHFHTLAAQRDMIGANSFLEDVRRTGARSLVGLDPEFTDSYALGVYERIGERFAVVPYRAGIYRNGEEQMTYSDLARVIWDGPKEPFLNNAAIQTTEALTQKAEKCGRFKFARKWQAVFERPEFDCSTAYAPVKDPGRLNYRGLTEESALAEVRTRSERFLAELNSPIDREQYTARLSKELQAIEKLQIAGYLLHLSDITCLAHKAQVPIGLGRGSSINSFVCFCLGVTQIDPVQEKLPFERFLNVNRRELPDVDIDVSRMHAARFRKEVTRHFSEACSLRTFSRPTLRAFLQRALEQRGVEPMQADGLMRELEDRFGCEWEFRGIEDLAGHYPEFGTRLVQAVGDERRAAWVVQLLEAIGTHRPTGSTVHESGVAVCREPLKQVVPLQPCLKGNEKVLCVAVPRFQAESQGVVKIDVLALDVLDQLRSVNRRIEADVLDQLRSVNRRIEAGGGKSIPLSGESLEEGMCRCVIDRGLLKGVFQFSKQAELLKELKVRSLQDLVFASGLIRVLEGSPSLPTRPEWIRQLPSELQKSYNEITKDTRGILVFQEQLSNALHHIGGLSQVRAEEIRRQIAKKELVDADSARGEFIERCQARFGARAEHAGMLFDSLSHNGAYLFNQGHARAYAGIAAAQISAKALYSAETIVELVRSARINCRGDVLKEQVSGLIYEARSLGVKVLGIDLTKTALTDVEVDRAKNGDYALSARAIRLGVDALSFLDNGQVRQLAERFRVTGPLSPQTVREHVSDENLITLISLGAWDKIDPDRWKLAGSFLSGRGGSVLTFPNLENSQQRFLGFLTDEVHPGIPKTDNSYRPSQLCGLDVRIGDKTKVNVVGFISKVKCGARVGPSGRVQASLLLTTYFGEKEAKVSRFFSSGEEMSAWVQKHQAIGPFLPVVIAVNPQRSGGRIYLNTYSDATPLKDVERARPDDLIGCAYRSKIKKLAAALGRSAARNDQACRTPVDPAVKAA